MSARPDCVPATHEHAEQLAPILSEADRQEIAAGSGLDPVDVLSRGVRHSTRPMAYIDAEGTPFAIRGVIPGGVIWMLSSDAIQKPQNRWFFARRVKSDLASDHAEHGRLGNLIDARNRVHVRLLEWLGFEFGTPVDRNGVTFLPFWRDRDV